MRSFVNSSHALWATESLAVETIRSGWLCGHACRPLGHGWHAASGALMSELRNEPSRAQLRWTASRACERWQGASEGSYFFWPNHGYGHVGLFKRKLVFQNAPVNFHCWRVAVEPNCKWWKVIPCRLGPWGSSPATWLEQLNPRGST